MSATLDAAYLTAHEYPGGTRGLALRMGVNGAVLSHKLNPNDGSNHLTVREFEAMLTLTGDHRALHALALDQGYMLLPLPGESDCPAMGALIQSVSESADFLKAASESLADGKVTKLELATVRKELTEMVAAAAKLEWIMEAMEAKGGRQ